MADKEMYDYLTTIAADVDVTLSVRPWRVLPEDGEKRQEIIYGSDGSEEVISQSDSSIFHVSLQWTKVSTSDSGTIFDIFHDQAKANGFKKSFKWSYPKDGHTYVVKFRTALRRSWSASQYQEISEVKLRVLGRIADA